MSVYLGNNLISGVGSIEVDQIFDGASANPQSGVAISGAGFETISNKVVSLNSLSTNDQYPSAKLTYDSLNTKVNSSDLIDVVCVVEEYQTGSVFVRTWSDGLIEQWCNDITYSAAAAHTITFPISYTSMPLILINYYVEATATTAVSLRNAGYARSATGFSVYFAANAHISYYARGY